VLGNLFYKLKVKKFSLGELEGDLFEDLSPQSYREVERYFLEQYALKMQYATPMGYRYRSNQTFNINRQIEEDGVQKQIIDETYKTCGFFSGSTGWGWGIFQRSDMIDYHIAKNLALNIYNYSNVGVNLYKIYTMFKQYEFDGTLPSRNIIYFGINEVYDLANNRKIFDSMRDKRIEKLIVEFDKYYRNVPLSLAYLGKQMLRSIALSALDIKNSFGKNFVDRLPPKQATKVLDEALYCHNMEIVYKMIKEMHTISPSTVFVLEPSLFHKELRSVYEEKLLHKKRLSDNLLEMMFERFYKEIIIFCRENGITVIDARESLNGVKEPLYFDYCHPYKEATKRIGEYIAREIEK